jgi:hypothetical protein
MLIFLSPFSLSVSLSLSVVILSERVSVTDLSKILTMRSKLKVNPVVALRQNQRERPSNTTRHTRSLAKFEPGGKTAANNREDGL